MYGIPEGTTEEQLADDNYVLENVMMRPHANIYIISLLFIVILLYPMHVFWGCLIVKMIIKLASTDKGDEYSNDLRSEDEEDTIEKMNRAV